MRFSVNWYVTVEFFSPLPVDRETVHLENIF